MMKTQKESKFIEIGNCGNVMKAEIWCNIVKEFIENTVDETPEEVRAKLALGDVQAQADYAAAGNILRSVWEASEEVDEDGDITSYLFSDQSVLIWKLTADGNVLAVTTLDKVNQGGLKSLVNTLRSPQ